MKPFSKAFWDLIVPNLINISISHTCLPLTTTWKTRIRKPQEFTKNQEQLTLLFTYDKSSRGRTSWINKLGLISLADTGQKSARWTRNGCKRRRLWRFTFPHRASRQSDNQRWSDSRWSFPHNYRSHEWRRGSLSKCSTDIFSILNQGL